MKNNEINIGEKIEILLDEGKKDERFFSKVEDAKGNEKFTISRPVSKRGFAYITKGQIIKIVYFREESAYLFDAEVIDCIKSESTLSFVVSAVSQKRKLQRRDFFRLSVMVPVNISFKLHGHDVTRKFDTADISGGGLKIMSLDKIEVGSKVELFIGIGGIEFEKITGTVVRCLTSRESSDLYDIGIRFADITLKNRQIIIQYIFAKQRELLRKGMK